MVVLYIVTVIKWWCCNIITFITGFMWCQHAGQPSHVISFYPHNRSGRQTLLNTHFSDEETDAQRSVHHSRIWTEVRSALCTARWAAGLSSPHCWIPSHPAHSRATPACLGHPGCYRKDLEFSSSPTSLVGLRVFPGRQACTEPSTSQTSFLSEPEVHSD